MHAEKTWYFKIKTTACRGNDTFGPYFRLGLPKRATRSRKTTRRKILELKRVDKLLVLSCRVLSYGLRLAEKKGRSFFYQLITLLIRRLLFFKKQLLTTQCDSDSTLLGMTWGHTLSITEKTNRLWNFRTWDVQEIFFVWPRHENKSFFGEGELKTTKSILTRLFLLLLGA